MRQFRRTLPRSPEKSVATSPTTGPAPAEPQRRPSRTHWPAVPFAAPTTEVERAKARGWKPLSIAIGLALFAASGAVAVYGSPANSTFATTRDQAIAGLVSAVDILKTLLEAITGSKQREEERAAIHDLGAALAQATVRLDQIQHQYDARLDRLSERIDQDSSTRFADIGARLDKLEQRAAAPTTSASELAGVVARLDALEKRATPAAAPTPPLADVTARLDKLEKKEAVTAPPSPEVPDTGPRLGKGEKKAAVPPASSVMPLPPAAPKQSMLMARADPSAANASARPDNSQPLRDYSVEDVRFGIAAIRSRHGSQQVAPGEMIPGAGRVLRIERRGANWVVVTSLGVIASGPAARQ